MSMGLQWVSFLPCVGAMGLSLVPQHEVLSSSVNFSGLLAPQVGSDYLRRSSSNIQSSWELMLIWSLEGNQSSSSVPSVMTLSSSPASVIAHLFCNESDCKFWCYMTCQLLMSVGTSGWQCPS